MRSRFSKTELARGNSSSSRASLMNRCNRVSRYLLDNLSSRQHRKEQLVRTLKTNESPLLDSMINLWHLKSQRHPNLLTNHLKINSFHSLLVNRKMTMRIIIKNQKNQDWINYSKILKKMNSQISYCLNIITTIFSSKIFKESFPRMLLNVKIVIKLSNQRKTYTFVNGAKIYYAQIAYPT